MQAGWWSDALVMAAAVPSHTLRCESEKVTAEHDDEEFAIAFSSRHRRCHGSWGLTSLIVMR